MKREDNLELQCNSLIEFAKCLGYVPVKHIEGLTLKSYDRICRGFRKYQGSDFVSFISFLNMQMIHNGLVFSRCNIYPDLLQTSIRNPRGVVDIVLLDTKLEEAISRKLVERTYLQKRSGRIIIQP